MSQNDKPKTQHQKDMELLGNLNEWGDNMIQPKHLEPGADFPSVSVVFKEMVDFVADVFKKCGPMSNKDIAFCQIETADVTQSLAQRRSALSGTASSVERKPNAPKM